MKSCDSLVVNWNRLLISGIGPLSYSNVPVIVIVVISILLLKLGSCCLI